MEKQSNILILKGKVGNPKIPKKKSYKKLINKFISPFV